MEKVESSFYTVCEKPKIVSFKTKKETSNFFDELLSLKPWAWKVALAFAVSFAAGWSVAEWARMSLMK